MILKRDRYASLSRTSSFFHALSYDCLVLLFLPLPLFLSLFLISHPRALLYTRPLVSPLRPTVSPLRHPFALDALVRH